MVATNGILKIAFIALFASLVALSLSIYSDIKRSAETISSK